jgi:hypothetical protein
MLSKNGIALLVLALEMVLSSLGIEFEPGSVAKVVEGIVILISLILMVWNQYNREDVEWFILKK